jgi:hypothetical protein
MKKFLHIFIALLLFFPENSFGFSWFTDYKLNKAYKNNDYKKVKEILEKEQVDSPNDAKLNYNLGAVCYKLNQLGSAKDSFSRCVKNCSAEQKELKEFAHFNLGNCLYEICLKLLPQDWEKMETIEDQKLNPAISYAQAAVENFNKVLALNEKNKRAKVNQKKAQDLLEKLLKKRKPQKNQQDQKDNKQQQEQQQQQQSQGNQKDSAKKDDKDKKDQQQQQQGHDGSQGSTDKADNRANNEFGDKQEAQKDKDVSQKSTHDQNSQKNEQQTARSQENGTKEEQEMQTQKDFGQEGRGDELKERGCRVILDDLQKDESKIQKMVIKLNTKEHKKNLEGNQKPW